MKTKNGLHLQAIVAGLVLALLMNPLANAVTQEPAPLQPSDPQSQNEQPTRDANSAPSQTAPPDSNSTLPAQNALPDSPGAAQKQQVQLLSSMPDPTPEEQSDQAVPPMPAPTPEEQQARPREPIGTAAAETVPAMGVAASRPAGAALAPAKQRRVRTFLIRMGAVLGVGAAVGVTMALSEGSPSKPPGAH